MAAPPPSITLPSKAMVAPVLCDEDLTDDQIKQLLQQAELRLRKQSTDLRAINKPTQSLPKLDVGNITQPYIKANGGISRVDSSYLLDKHARDLADQPRKAKSNSVEKKKLAEEQKATAGPDWFNLPRTNLSDKLKMDLKLLGMRSVLDPKRHYRKDNFRPEGPKYSQVGTIIEGPTEFFSARLQNRERKQTIVEEVMAGEAQNGRFKREYLKRQVAKTSGRKKFYKELKAKRSRKK